MKVSPRILGRLGRQLQECIIVTGTNGKTTTANLLGDMLQQERPWIQNRAGSNMIQGLVSTLLRNTNWFGRLRNNRALFEIDEATLPLVVQDLPVSYAVLTNVFRDQLDRYGELDTTLDKLIDGLSRTQATLLVNADDPLSHHVARSSGRPTTYFGFHVPTQEELGSVQPDSTFPRDGAFCMTCGDRLVYSGWVYGQLGAYACPTCSFARPQPDFEADRLGQSLRVEASVGCYDYEVPVAGLFNAYNALAAIAAAHSVGLSPDRIARGMASFESPVGRMQLYRTRVPVVLNLIKNPTGADNVLQAVTSDGHEKVVCIIINDHAADGRDVSWLWDTQFEALVSPQSGVRSIITAGRRAEDMALRLKYATQDGRTDTIASEPNAPAAIQQSIQAAQDVGATRVHVMATYTALAPAAECLSKLEGASHDNALHRAPVS